MKSKKPNNKPVTVLRWNGEEYRFNEGDREFIQSMLAQRLGYAKAIVIEVQQTFSHKASQCVIAPMDETMDYDSNEGLASLQEAVDNATAAQRAFIIEYTYDEYQNILNSRNRKLHSNVFDLFQGYRAPVSSDELEPEPTLA